MAIKKNYPVMEHEKKVINYDDDSVRELWDNIIEGIQRYIKALNDFTCGNDKILSIQLQREELMEDWMELYYYVKGFYQHKDIIKPNDDEKRLNYMLYAKSFYKAVESLYGKFDKLYETYGRAWRSEWFRCKRPEVIEFYKKYVYICDYDEAGHELEDTLSHIEEWSEKSFQHTESTLSLLGNEITGLAREAKLMMEKCMPSDGEIEESVVLAIRKYSHISRERTRRNLVKEVRELVKSERVSLTQDDWEKAILNEYKIWDKVKEKKLLEYNKEHSVVGYTDDQLRQMEQEYELIDRISSVSEGPKLFDFQYALDVNLYSVLTPDNLELFQYIILRHDLLRYEAFPDLKPQYEAWYNGTDNSKGRLYSKLQGSFFSPTVLDAFIEFLMQKPEPTEITAEVKRLKKIKGISDLTQLTTLHEILNSEGIYPNGYEAFRIQINGR